MQRRHRRSDSASMHVGPAQYLKCSLAITAVAFVTAVHARQVSQNWQRAVATEIVAEKPLGLLNLPEIIGEGCGPANPARTALYAAPSASGAPTASITLIVQDRMPDGGACGPAQLVARPVGRGV